MSKPVKAIPEGMHSVTPHLVCDGAAAAIDFYKRAFGATGAVLMPGPDGKVMHAQVRIGDSAVMLVDENRAYGMLGPKAIGGTPVTIHLYVEDVDAVYQRAVAEGAKATMPPSDMFWGDRYGVLEDPFGHHWSIATHKREVTADEMKQAMSEMSSQAPS